MEEAEHKEDKSVKHVVKPNRVGDWNCSCGWYFFDPQDGAEHVKKMNEEARIEVIKKDAEHKDQSDH